MEVVGKAAEDVPRVTVAQARAPDRIQAVIWADEHGLVRPGDDGR